MKALLVTGKGPADSTAEFFCYYAVPEGPKPSAGWPGVVLVHGAGGTAFPKYVREWQQLGFAVIAPNWYNCRTAPGSTNAPPYKGEPPSIPLPGGRRQDHVANVANMVLAHSLLRSFPEVDACRTVFVGLSWGSWYGGCVAAVDSRFRGCVEIYCGDLWPDVRKGRELVNGRFLHAAKVPMWWIVSTNDNNAKPDSLNAAFAACGRWDGVTVVNQLPHSHVGFDFPAVHRMARYYTGSAKRLPRLGMPRLEGGKVVARVLDAGGGIDRVKLGYTLENTLPVDKRRWQYADAEVVGETVCAALPKGTVQCYLAAFEKGESRFGDLCGTTPFFTVPSVPVAGVTFRFDDAHPASQWKELTQLFDARGFKATFAINGGYVETEEQKAFLREAAGRGHELIDHTHDHAIFSYRYRDAADRDRLKDDPAVVACSPEEGRLNLRYEIDLAHPANFRFRGFVTNGVLVVTPDVARKLHRPNKVYVPSLDRTFGFFDAPDGHIVLRTFWTTKEAKLPDVPESELVCLSCRAFRVSDDVLRFQARRSREAFLRLGVPVPKAWAQPGGWEPYLNDVDFRRIYADEFGYVLGDAFVPRGEKSDPRLASFHNRYRSYFDNASVTPETIRRDIRAAVAKGETLSFISHMKPPKGQTWEQWLKETADLLDWLKAEKVPVLTASEMGVWLSSRTPGQVSGSNPQTLSRTVE